VAGNDGDIQYSSSKFLASRTFQVNGQDANGFNVIANNVGGSNGSAGIAVLSNDGNGSALVRMGTAVGGGFAGDFLLTYNSNYPIRIKSNGNFQINGHGQSDNGRNFQIYGNASISTVVDYADDAAAAAGGVPVTGVYRTGSALKIRVS
jgi:diacylglycerol kinase family enzyme